MIDGITEKEVPAMQANVGDRIVVHWHRAGEFDRDCEVMEVLGADGGPPYVVCWGENGEALFFPGPDAEVEHGEAKQKSRCQRTVEGLRRSGVGVEPDRSIRQAAAIMNDSGVGSLAVVEEDRPIGIVTDRDIVRRAVAEDIPMDARIDSVMSTPVITIDDDADIRGMFGQFRTHAVRRLVVVRNGRFLGMVTADDLLVDLAHDLADLARPVSAEVLFAHRDSPLPASP